MDAEINGPRQIAVDEKGDIYIYQSAFIYRGVQLVRVERGTIRRIDSVTHKIATVTAGCEPRLFGPPVPGMCFGFITHLFASSNQLFLSDLNFYKLWALDLASLRLSPIAGNGDHDPGGSVPLGDDGKRALQIGIGMPSGFTVDSRGNIFICASRRVRRVDAKTGIISTVVGNGKVGLAGDGGPATEAELTSPSAIAVDQNGDLYIADSASFRIRRVDAATGIIETIAGNGQRGFRGDGGAATDAGLDVLGDLASDTTGTLTFMTGWRICQISQRTGILSTLAGTGEPGFSGDGGLATAARIEAYAFAMDKDGNVFTAEYENNRIRRIDAKTGIITTVGGDGLPRRAPTPVY